MHLGHPISEKGIETDTFKMWVIKGWPVPKTVTEVRSFLGFTSYYQCFIHKYSHVAEPLHKIISGDNASKENKMIQWVGKVMKPSGNVRKSLLPLLFGICRFQDSFQTTYGCLHLGARHNPLSESNLH